MPIIQSLQNSLICNHINSIVGIINGTSNYILSAMGEHGADYEDALVQAQKLGFAEEDPSLDVNGWDAAHKALILATLAYGTTISPDKIYVSGIENITSRDFEFAKKLGYTIKLLVVIRYHENQEDALELRVQPCFVHDWHILASVNGVFNAISVNGDIVGETLFYGRGAGKNPTASAVISDVITAMRESRYPEFHTGFTPYAKSCGVMHINDTTTPYYVRFQVADQPGVIAEIARILATFGIGISATSSAPSHIDEDGVAWNDLVFILHTCPWGQLQMALEEIAQISFVAPEARVLRIEHLLPQS
ncbi:homoserine dehydrogenase [Akkermansia muciniphila]|nr:homoserine dehydrogenase [Akkermansia muciniphila]